MSVSRRTQRIASLIRAELARLILEEMAEPTMAGICITDVKVTNDLQIARVYFTHSNDTFKPKEIEKGLLRAHSFFRRKIGENLDLRHVPTFEFHQDKHGESVARLYSLFDSVERENKSRGEEVS